MRDLNKVIVSGRAVKEPEFKELDGLKIATFTLACNYDQTTSFLPVTCFNGLANIASQYVTEGKAIQLEGILKQNRFQNKEGKNRSRLNIIAQRIHLNGGKNPKAAS